MWMLVAASIAVGAPAQAKLERVTLQVDSTHGVATMTVALSKKATGQLSSLTIDVPHGTRVTAMSITIGEGRAKANAMRASLADQRFRVVVSDCKDPALLELTDSTPDVDRMTLHVFPVAKTAPATVDVTIELPLLDVLTVEADARVRLELDGTPVLGRRIKLPPRRDWMTADPTPRAHVSAETSLFAADPRALSAPLHVPQAFGCGIGDRIVERTVSATQIRRRVKLAIPRLLHCYMRRAQGDPSLAGTAVLHFAIDHAGRPTGISVDGSLGDDDTRMCLAEEVTTWNFPRTDIVTQVNYPLTFRLADR